MPCSSSSSHFLLRGFSVSQLQKCLPKQWKQNAKPVDVHNCGPAIETDTSHHVSMIDNLLTSLKEFARQGVLLKAFETFSLIKLHKSPTNHDIILHSVSSLLLSCTSLKSLSQGKQLHAHVISLGFENHHLLVPKLVSFYLNFSLLPDAHSITESSNILHPLPWNLLISSYVNNGLHGKGLSAYKQMVHRGIRPDNFTYPSILKACGEELDLAFGRELHQSINASGHAWNLYVHNSLVSMYGKFGEMDVARHLFDQMLERDAVSWNGIISSYASKGMWREAFELFDEMRSTGAEVSIVTWNIIAGGCLRTGNSKGALQLFSQMRSCGIHLDPVAMIIGLGACWRIGAVNLGAELHGSAIRSCFDGFDNVRNALITMYSRFKDPRHTEILFQTTEAKSIITWNSMLSGYTCMDRYVEASCLFRKMLFSGLEPNYVTISSILPLCARVANLQHGKEFHCYIVRREGFEEYLLLWNSLVDMYARSGKVLEARRVFNSMRKQDEVTYTSLIAGYGVQGEGKTALKLFDDMIKHHIKPDQVTMVAALSACSHSGLVAEGNLLFKQMFRVYGIVPVVEHYSCMVDLFGRAGLLHKAKDVITSMPYMPTSAMWATLLGSCRIHGNIEMGEWAAEKLLEMNPESPGYYVLIANMYAAAGRWNKLAKVRTCMRDLGVRKDPGCAWVDVGPEISSFMAGDSSKLNSNELYQLLHKLSDIMTDSGGVAREKFGSEDELLDETKCCHM